MTKTTLLGFIAALSVAGMSARAQVWHEVSDAPSLMPGQSVGNGTVQVVGSEPLGDVDLYAFHWAGGVLTIDASGTAYNAEFPEYDTQLSLFYLDGVGIGENDDIYSEDIPRRQSQISINLGAGNYLVALTEFNNDALDQAGTEIFSFGGGFRDLNENLMEGPLGRVVLASFNGRFGQPGSHPSGGDYQIRFSAPVDAVPEPTAAAIIVASVVGLPLLRVRRI